MRARHGRIIIILIIIIAIILLLVKPKSFTNDDINKDNELLELAILENSIKICDDISHPYIKDRCFLDLAVKEKDCKKIKDLRGKYACLSNLASLGQAEVCISIIDDQFYSDLCNMNAGISTQNIDACTLISVQNDSFKCIKKVAFLNKNSAECFKLKGLDISYCIRDIAENTQDSEMCSEIPNVVIRSVCKGKIAETLNDKELCENIQVETVKNSCLERIKSSN